MGNKRESKKAWEKHSSRVRDDTEAERGRKNIKEREEEQDRRERWQERQGERNTRTCAVVRKLEGKIGRQSAHTGSERWRNRRSIEGDKDGGTREREKRVTKNKEMLKREKDRKREWKENGREKNRGMGGGE